MGRQTLSAKVIVSSGTSWCLRINAAISGQLLEIMSEGEDEKTKDSNNNGYEEGGGGERTSLMLDKEVRLE